jgi:hypothetical protein
VVKLCETPCCGNHDGVVDGKRGLDARLSCAARLISSDSFANVITLADSVGIPRLIIDFGRPSLSQNHQLRIGALMAQIGECYKSQHPDSKYLQPILFTSIVNKESFD